MAPQLDFHQRQDKVLSLCLPTYNRAHCLREQFNRLLTLKQEDLARMEIIISDNCIVINIFYFFCIYIIYSFPALF
mgnify:CR=1 FL=1